MLHNVDAAAHQTLISFNFLNELLQCYKFYYIVRVLDYQVSRSGVVLASHFMLGSLSSLQGKKNIPR
jgi:hypothetical protein